MMMGFVIYYVIMKCLYVSVVGAKICESWEFYGREKKRKFRHTRLEVDPALTVKYIDKMTKVNLKTLPNANIKFHKSNL